MGAAVHADPAGTVRAASHRDAEALQPIRHAAEGSRDPGRDLGRAHALAAHHRAEVRVRQLGEKLLHRPPALGRIAQLPPPVAGIGKTGGEPPKPLLQGRDGLERRRFPGRNEGRLSQRRFFPHLGTQPVEGLYGGHGLFAGADTDGLRQGEATGLGRAAHIGADFNPIFPLFQHPGRTVAAAPAVVIGSEEQQRKVKVQRLRVARREQGSLAEADQDAGGLPERSLRRAAVDLDDLFPGDGSGVADRNRERNGLGDAD